MKVNVLGTKYEIKYAGDEETRLEELDGYCDTSSKEIIVRIFDEDLVSLKNLKEVEKAVTRHEIIHAFLYESGLNCNSNATTGAWAANEEMIDWIALQFPKILDAFYEADCI